MMRRSVENRKVKVKGTNEYKTISTIVPNAPALKSRRRHRRKTKKRAGKKTSDKTIDKKKKKPVKGKRRKKKKTSVKNKSDKPPYEVMYT